MDDFHVSTRPPTINCFRHGDTDSSTWDPPQQEAMQSSVRPSVPHTLRFNDSTQGVSFINLHG